jgi:excisionase family DNA binding protein
VDTREKTERAALNVIDAARYVGIGETRFRDLLRSGAIGSRRVGRRYVIAKVELDRWLSGQPEARL